MRLWKFASGSVAKVLVHLCSWDEKQVEALIEQFDKNKDWQQVELRIKR